MVLKIYKVKTTAGNYYAVGVFNGGEMLKGASPRYYKKKSNAIKAMAKIAR